MIVDRYLNKVYHQQNYNCAHFVCDVWKELNGFDLAGVLRGFLGGREERKAFITDLRKVKLLKKPENPCIVWFQSLKSQTHVGVWLNGKVLHIGRLGVHYQPLEVAAAGFKRVRFFTC